METLFTMEYVKSIIEIMLNSNVGMMVAASIVGFIYVRFFKDASYTKAMRDNKWFALLTPYAVDAIKWAEKKIPDNTPHKAAAKADFAMRFVLDTIKRVENPDTLPKDIGELIKLTIQSVHGKMEQEDKLPFPNESSATSSVMPQPELLDEMDTVVSESEMVNSSSK